MKLFSIFILYKEPEKQAKILKCSQDLASFGYFQRGRFVYSFVCHFCLSINFNFLSVAEFMKFTSKILVERTPVTSRSSVKEQEYMAHAHVRNDNLAGVIISDQEYPNRVAHTLINKVLEDFSKAVPNQTWTSIAEE
jgi:synaptobrevin family protein YKT6